MARLEPWLEGVVLTLELSCLHGRIVLEQQVYRRKVVGDFSVDPLGGRVVVPQRASERLQERAGNDQEGRTGGGTEGKVPDLLPG